jgi:hypothetical protein
MVSLGVLGQMGKKDRKLYILKALDEPIPNYHSFTQIA